MAPELKNVVKYTNPPGACNLCGKNFNGVMFDARMQTGSWGNFCQRCFDELCIGLGTGRGQKYEMDEQGIFIKIEG